MSRLTSAEYNALAQRAYATFKRFPNVHSVGIGGRERSGRLTGELVITVFVSRKLAPSALPADAVIPPEFEGIPTDVVELGPDELLVEPSGDLSDVPGMPADEKDEDKDKYRPLRGGIQIEGAHGIGSGTLGFLCKVQGDNRVMAVTNWHVLFDNNHMPEAEMRVGNPDSQESCTKCCIGAFGRHVAEDYLATDAAIARLDPSMEWLAEIKCIGSITGWNIVTEPEAQSGTYRVRKYGRTTRLTGGIIRNVNVVSDISAPNRPDRHYTNGIRIQPNPRPGEGPVKFLDEGDSGSAIVNDANEIVGVAFAGNKTAGSMRFGWGVAFPVDGLGGLAPVFQAKSGIQLIPATATRLGDVQRTLAAPVSSATDQVSAAAMAEAAELARRIELELAQSERGRLMTSLWMRHSTELDRLVNANKKVGALWRRNSGPALFHHALRAVRLPDLVIPMAIEGRPVEDCVEKVIEVFAHYGSDALRADIHAHRAELPPLAGRSYQDILTNLSDRDQD